MFLGRCVFIVAGIGGLRIRDWFGGGEPGKTKAPATRLPALLGRGPLALGMETRTTPNSKSRRRSLWRLSFIKCLRNDGYAFRRRNFRPNARAAGPSNSREGRLGNATSPAPRAIRTDDGDKLVPEQGSGEMSPLRLIPFQMVTVQLSWADPSYSIQRQ